MKRSIACFLVACVSAMLLSNRSFGVMDKDAYQLHELQKTDPAFLLEPSQGNANETEVPKWMPGRLVVKYRSYAIVVPTKRAASLFGFEKDRGVLKRNQLYPNQKKQARQKTLSGKSLPDLSTIYELEFAPDADIEKIAQEFRKNSDVVYAHPNQRYQIMTLPNDPAYLAYGSWDQDYYDLWGPRAMNMEVAWAITKGAGTIIAVVDTGLDYNHPDIWENVLVNPDVIVDRNGDHRVDLDDADLNGNHKIDHKEVVDHMFGWDFTECSRFTRYGICREKLPDNNPYDRNGHGTHVAGTATAAENDIGVVGIAPEAKILSVKGLTDDGYGFDTWLAASIVYAADHNATVINNSWGCDNCELDEVVEDAIEYANALGISVVFAAGNSSIDVKFSSPANQENVIAVSACTQSDRPAFFTNFGTGIDICAPGGGDVDWSSRRAYLNSVYNILSLKARQGRDVRGGILRYNKKYYRLTGTSMAAPHIAGLIALIRAQKPWLTPEEIRWILNASARDIYTPGFDVFTGPGMPDAARALQIDSVITVQLSTPTDGAFFDRSDNTIEIVGSVQGTNVASWQLFYGEGRTPTEWHPLGNIGTTSVDNALLAAWDISEIPDGMYTLRLAAHSQEGWTFQTINQIRIEFPPDHVLPSNSEQRKPKVFGTTAIWEEYFYSRINGRLHDFSSDTTWWLRENDSAHRFGFDISDNTVVGFTSDPTYYYSAFEYDIENRTLGLIAEVQNLLWGVATSGDKRLWLECTGSDGFCLEQNIMLKDSTGRVTVIDPALAFRYDPQLSSSYALWNQIRGRRNDWYWQLRGYKTETQTAFDFPVPVHGSQVYGRTDGEFAIWNEHTGTAWRVRACSFSDLCQSSWWVTSEEESCIYPDIAGGKVVCASNRAGNWDIRFIDVVTGNSMAITADTVMQLYPAITEVPDGWRVVWQDGRWANDDVFWQIGSKFVAKD